MADSVHRPSIAICHLRQDEATAADLLKRLNQLGADPWLVARESGGDWEDALETAVRGADAMVVCLRPGFEDLAKSQDEVKVALRVNRQAPFGPDFLIPFIVEPVEGDRPTRIEELVAAINRQCASNLKASAASDKVPSSGAAPEGRAVPSFGAREASPPRAPSRSFSAGTRPPRRKPGGRLALGSLLVLALLAFGYWYWPEGKPIDTAAGGGAETGDASPPPSTQPAGLAVADTLPPKPATEDPPGPGEARPLDASAEPSVPDGRIERYESPNQEPGRAEFKPEAIVIHSMDSGRKLTHEWQMNPSSGSSMHYSVGLNGDIAQYVDEQNTAFHLGRRASSNWPLYKPGRDPNLYTIGIDHESLVGHAWPENQIQASAALIRRICLRWEIPIDRRHVLGHHEAFPLDIPAHRHNLTVKPCPGEGADLDRLVRLAAAGSDEQGPASSAPASAAVDGRQGRVRAIANLKIRKGAPSTSAPSLRTAEAGAVLPYVGWIEGERVAGNPFWYQDPTGDYFWAGGTSRPNPTAP